MITYPDLNNYSNILCLDSELWKAIPDYEAIYSISNFGRIKNTLTNKVLKVSYDTKGYPQIQLKKKNFRIHRLVASCFLKSPSEKLWEECKKSGVNYVPVNHIDKNPKNSHISNLEWCSLSYNNYHSVEDCKYDKNSGSGHYFSKLIESDVREILLQLQQGISQSIIAKNFDVKPITISNIKTGRSWNRVTGFPKTERSWTKRNTLKLSERDCH